MPFSFNFGGFNPGDFSGFGGYQSGESAPPPPKKPKKPRKAIGNAFTRTLINLGVIYLVLIAMIGLTLFLSARMRSPYQVLIVVVPVLFIPMFLSPNGTSGLYNLLVFLTPYQSLKPNFGSYLSYQPGPVVLDAFAMRAVLYGVLALILLPLARIGFQKHQVS